MDDPITPAEVKHVIDHQLKPGKGAGPDGISPGLFKLLPGEWLVFLCTLFNSIFVMGYPMKCRNRDGVQYYNIYHILYYLSIVYVRVLTYNIASLPLDCLKQELALCCSALTELWVISNI